jgi:hypothetical protein
LWEDTFTGVAQRVPSPGGTHWCGEGAEAAGSCANADLLKVRTLADDLRVVAAVARNGERDLGAAKQTALAAITRANDEGFEVSERLTVTSRVRGGSPEIEVARRVRAATLAAEIHSRAVALVAADEAISNRITTAATGLGTFRFDPVASQGDLPDGSKRKPGVQLLDFPQKPAPDPSPGGGSSAGPVPTAQSILDTIKNLPIGTQDSIREIRDPAQLQQFEDWIMQHSTEYTGGSVYRGGGGVRRQLADGTIVGFGPSARFGPTSDIKIPVEQVTLPSGQTIKLHLDPQSGGQMTFPPGVTPELPPPAAAPKPEIPPATPRVEPSPASGGAPSGGQARADSGGAGLGGGGGGGRGGGWIRPFPGFRPPA